MSLLMRWLTSAALLLWCSSVAAQGINDPSEVATDTKPVQPSILPESLPDGRPLYPIGIYQSQMVELIPDTFRPVSLQRLNDAIESLSDLATDDQSSRLRGAEFWIKLDRDKLISERSVLDLESDRDALIRRSLGRVNFAIDQPTSRTLFPAKESLPRLESGPGGNLIAVFNGGTSTRTRIEFKWRLNGRSVGSGHEFTLRLPRSPQTRIVLAAPSDIEIESLDGVLRARPGPPADAGRLSADRDSRWYEIDAGGLSGVRIRTRPMESPKSERALIVRRSLIQYDIDSAGINWMQRMSVQVSADQKFPPMKVTDATVTSVKVNASEVGFTTTFLDDHSQQILFESPPGVVNSQSMSTTVTVTGQSLWTGSCRLPIGRWTGDRIVHASAMDEVQLAVASPFQVVAWELPNDWSQSKPQNIGSAQLLSASGPPIGIDQTSSIESADKTSTNSKAWSEVQFSERPLLRSADRWLRLDVGKTSMRARSRLEISVDPTRLEPIELQIEKGFTLDSLIFVNSQRSIESPVVNEATDTVELWPEPQDVMPPADTTGMDEGSMKNDGSALLIIEVGGSRALPPASPAVVVPPSWFAAVRGVRDTLTAAIIPPADLNWSGEASLLRDRIRASDLQPEQLAFFSGVDRSTLYFAPPLGRTPEVLLETPSVSFDASTVLQVVRDGSEVIEQLVVDVESAGQTLSQLVIQTDALAMRPSYTWSLAGENELPSTSLPLSDITVGDGEDAGTYRIDVSELNLRGRPLIARRRYAVADRFSLQLPSVPGAATQRSEVMLGNGLLVQSKSNSVQLVPVVDSQSNNEQPTTSAMLADPNSRDQSTLDAPMNDVPHQRLRYDAVEQPSIEVAKVDSNSNVTVVRRETIRVIASSRGTDRIEASYHVSTTAPLLIQYPPELLLASIHRDGVAVNLDPLDQRRIELTARDATETIQIVWNRSQFGSRWFRRCRIPRIRVSGAVLKSEYQLIAASDTFAPAALFQNHPHLQPTDALELLPGDSVILVRRNIALACGWLIALLTFAVGWSIASRRPLVVAMIVVILTALTFLWWPWKLAVIGWLIVPTIAAAMLATSRSWTNRPNDLREDSQGTELAKLPNKSESSEELSWASIIRTFLFATFASASLAMVADAQSPSSNAPEQPTNTNTVTSHRHSVDVLVPLDEEGKISGDIVYLPRSVLTKLFPSETANQPQQPYFQSAEYRVRIVQDTNNDKASNATVSNSFDTVAGPTIGINDVNRRTGESIVEAEFLIHLIDGSRGSNQLKLPIAFEAVRRVELIDEVDRIVRFTSDEAGKVIAYLPKGESFRVRVTMAPAISLAQPWTKLLLSIPPIASSRLTVEADKNIEALRVGGSKGQLLPETDLRRWVTELGPTDSLEIDYRNSVNVGSTTAKPLHRRYWVNAGKLQTVIECEVDPPTAIAAGESFQFVIRDAETPLVTSPNWRMSGTELYSPTRHLMTMTALRDSPGPIRLLWVRDRSAMDSNRAVEFPGILDNAKVALPAASPQVITLPEVIAAALGENAPAWIALYCDRSLSFAPIVREQSEPLSVDQFMAAWSGYRGLIDRAIVAMNSLPSLELRSNEAIPGNVMAQHHLHVMPDRLELRFDATIISGDDSMIRHRLSVPKSLNLLQLSVGGIKLHSPPIESDHSFDYLLGDLPPNEPVVVSAMATEILPQSLRFSPPRMRVMPSIMSTDTYSISRDGSTSLRVVKPVPFESAGPTTKASAESLAQGWIPVATWSVPPNVVASNSDLLGGEFQVNPRQTRFDCRQLISLTRDDGRWRMQTQIKFDRKRIPDFIDVEVPTRWCELLDVEPITSWSRQPATDPTQQIVRIRCDPTELRDQTLTVTGTLQSSDAGRVGVPTVRVLGFGERRVHISVPDRLTNEPIQWRTSAVEAVGIPEVWRDTLALAGEQSTYLAASPAWSIDLAPLPTLNSEAIALTQDNQVLPQDDNVLVITHWDLFPGGLESVLVAIPPGSRCVGGWSAGQSVLVESETAETTKNLVRIPLALSRLSQSVELLIRVPSEVVKQGSYIPSLVDIPVTQNWVCVYQTNDQTATVVDAQERRAVSLARSVVESVEQAVDIIAERPSEEVAAWLSPWVTRYRQLANIAGHHEELNIPDEPNSKAFNAIDLINSPATPSGVSGVSVSDVRDSDSTAAGELQTDKSARPNPAEMQWKLLDQRMAVYASRYLPDPPPVTESTFDVSHFEGFVPFSVKQLSAANRPPSIQPISTGDRGLRNLIMNGLTLTLVAGLLICMRPLQRFALPVVAHPAFWIGVLGLFGFAVAPLPVAAALILVAVSLPVFPSPKRS